MLTAIRNEQEKAGLKRLRSREGREKNASGMERLTGASIDQSSPSRWVRDGEQQRVHTVAIERRRAGRTISLHDALGAVDCHDSGTVKVDATPPLLRWRTWRLQSAPPRRP